MHLGMVKKIEITFDGLVVNKTVIAVIEGCYLNTKKNVFF